MLYLPNGFVLIGLKNGSSLSSFWFVVSFLLLTSNSTPILLSYLLNEVSGVNVLEFRSRYPSCSFFKYMSPLLLSTVSAPFLLSRLFPLSRLFLEPEFSDPEFKTHHLKNFLVLFIFTISLFSYLYGILRMVKYLGL